MNDLYSLIEKHGAPDALIDHWDPQSQAWAIWGFDEIFSMHLEDFIINEKINDNPLDNFQNTLNRWKATDSNLSAIGFLSYDIKNILYPHLNFKSVFSSKPLIWFAKPTLSVPYKPSRCVVSDKLPILYLIEDIPVPTKYKDSLSTIKQHLRKGDSYQINFTQPKRYRLSEDPLKVFLHIRKFNCPYYGMYINTSDFQILSFSPERFFRTRGKKIDSFPMKGTRPRSENSFMDKKLYEDLCKSRKDKAEHLMIVDLIRNDLGKITEYGTVGVENLYHVKSFDSVHQMESRVWGQLKENIIETDVFKALFPGGSITGAPKERSMEIIDSLEKYNRHIYTGAIGTILNNGDMDFNIAIRTMTVENSVGEYTVGGGIVWDSDPLEEWREAQEKSQFLSAFTNSPVEKPSLHSKQKSFI